MLPLLAIGLGIWINPLDPLWSHAAFPWTWFAPVILAMRYGPFPGLAGAAVLVVAWAAFQMSGWVLGEFPKLNFLGGLILVMLAGEFSSLWLARARRAESVQLYLDQRLEYLTHQYYLLRLSHDRLEQDLIGRPMAMRDALTALQDLARDTSNKDRLPGAANLLRLLAQYCQIESAALYVTTSAGLTTTPGASMGQLDNNGQLCPSDPLVVHALEAGQLSHIASSLGSGDHPSRYVIVAPITTFSGENIGLLAVERVPFFALHDEMLQTLNLLLGYYADGLIMRELATEIREAFPGCPVEFAAELQRLWRVSDESRVRSVIVALEFHEHAEFEDLSNQIQRQRRSLDVSWLIESPHKEVLVTLMPLAGNAAAEGYITRIEQWVRQKGKPNLDEARIFPHILYIGDKAPIPLLNHLFEICNVPAQARTLRADS